MKRSINPQLVERAMPENPADEEQDDDDDADDRAMRVRRLHE